MRLFQNVGLYPSYFPRLAMLSKGSRDFSSYIQTFLDDRFGAPHYLTPVLSRDPESFFTIGDYSDIQRMWAREQGMRSKADNEEILLAQIEHQRSEVFYNMDPMRFGSQFVRRLPGCVKRSIAWRAAPSPGADFGAYDRIVCNFPTILQHYKSLGWKAAYFSPAHDPELDAYASNTERPIDVLFVGGYSRHHKRRASILDAVSELRGQVRVDFRLDRSRLTRLAESALGKMLPLAAHRRPKDISAVSGEPVFGRSLYKLLSQSKIVLNGAVDMAGEDRGNMRCFEAMGSGALMISDDGRYPEHMIDGTNFRAYKSASQAVDQIRRAIDSPEERRVMAARGHEALSLHYSKAMQWKRFQQLISEI
ncbi:glycosyl transferase family 1 [Panacagrimonas perspica]|uniref:Glycosyl transferase family 1 n=1 Tax=Panacagrimonas perspica TaxID=381431 RepID=A0A4R7NSU4_9GAMM|nr:glycosyltransferase [Panacagrimonas perspica]TDU24134.1 glycosyl transferase family 1 [Panacagrimonas perspica]THD04778.1 hypothetical protein B1810_03780 [Panacagrimonas perspica]